RYTIWLFFTLFVEPQINPLKHFPTVTVAHKLMVPLLFQFTRALSSFMDPWLAAGLAPILLGFIPGVFGYLMWEFFENWQLYRANRPRELKPVQVGEHGEEVIHLMRP